MIYKGKIFKIPFPFTDLSALKKRPVLALSEPNEFGDIKFAFITTKNHRGSNQVPLKENDFIPAPLPLKSFIQLDKIVLLNKEIIIKELSELKETVMLKLQRRLVIIETETFYHDRFGPTEFIPGKTRVNYAGRVFDEKKNLQCR